MPRIDSRIKKVEEAIAERTPGDWSDEDILTGEECATHLLQRTTDTLTKGQKAYFDSWLERMLDEIKKQPRLECIAPENGKANPDGKTSPKLDERYYDRQRRLQRDWDSQEQMNQ